MNEVLREMLDILEGDDITRENAIMHYGMPRRSGRYPWGSGESPYQHSGDFLSRVEELKKQKITFTDEDGNVLTGEVAIARTLGMSTRDLRAACSIARNERRLVKVQQAKDLRDKGYGPSEAARMMGLPNESSYRALLSEDSEARMNKASTVADILRSNVDEKGMIMVGTGVERQLGITKTKMEEALAILDMEGYHTFGGGVAQVTNKGKQTNLRVLCPPDTPYKVDENGRKTSSAIYDLEKIHYIDDVESHDGGDTFDPKWVYPKSMDSKRLMIRYAEEGGLEKDGLIELRRGVPDLSLGESRYSQVRILVDDDRYMKGMAVYSDDMPDGVDVIFNTNKKLGKPMRDVLKPIKDDPTNPFGSLIKSGIEDPDNPGGGKGGQSYYYDENGVKQLSLINKRSDEGDWDEWGTKLPSQFLSKQPLKLAKQQLGLAAADKESEFDEIMSLENPTVKRKLLESFADDCDSAAVHLKAAALPRQRYQVIVPLKDIKDNEVYAPNYEDGETVALIRYPHAGTFEIPILSVNNKNAEGRKMLGTMPKDAVGINKVVADRLSGADFDGDTVMVIPCNSKKTPGVKILSTPVLKGLEGFEGKDLYGPSEVRKDADGKEHYYRNGREYRTMKDTQKQMGVVSNLITDMTLLKANDSEMERAVRHSMVVIDAEKHHLDYKASEIDNDIPALKKRYQGVVEDGRYHEGAATLLSRAKSEVSVPKRRGSAEIDPVTGEKTYKPAFNLTYTDSKGEVQTRKQQSTRMAEAKDARSLISTADTPMENAYADYANKMKALGNKARLEVARKEKLKYDPSAAKVYADEVRSLDAKLGIAEANAPKERKAQINANIAVQKAIETDPDLKKSNKKGDLKKVSQRALVEARVKAGAQRHPIDVTDREWEAIQAGAISDNMLSRIIDNSDIDTFKQRAMPRTQSTLSQAKQNKIAAMRDSGYTTEQIAQAVGVSSSTVYKYSG